MSAYNAQDTINKAIDSVLAQTHKDLELIIVNDSSTDDTDNIVKQYSDERINYIKHDVNKGAGLARRSGIHAATGDYIAFLDSDDYYAKECIEMLVRATDNGIVDVVSPGAMIVSGDQIIKKAPTPIDTTEDVLVYDNSGMLHFLNIQLIRRSLFDNVEYSDRRFIEDSSTFVKILHYAKNRKVIDYAGYYYVQRDNSLIHECSTQKRFLYTMLCAKDVCEFYEQVGTPDKFNFYHFLYKYLCMNEDLKYTKEDGGLYKDERQELLQFITEQFNKRL